MPAGPIDRRVARTRSRLQQALFRLTAEKGYTAITVEDICREADVGRSTFYTHYPDKDYLRKATIDEHMKGCRHVVPNAIRREMPRAFPSAVRCSSMLLPRGRCTVR